jgi:DNA-directed RNA polymerase subunit RPC12/RpoP
VAGSYTVKAHLEHFDSRLSSALRKLKISTHAHRHCPHCHSRRVCRERRRGVEKLISILGIRLYRCIGCDRLHFGFSF